MYEQPNYSFGHKLYEIPGAHGWYYGEQIKGGEITAAMKILMDHGLVYGQRAMGGTAVGARLTSDGVTCVEFYDASLQLWIHRNSTGAVSTTIGTYNQNGGNNAVGSSEKRQSLWPLPDRDRSLQIVEDLIGVFRIALLDRTMTPGTASKVEEAVLQLKDGAPAHSTKQALSSRLGGVRSYLTNTAGNSRVELFLLTGIDLALAHIADHCD